MKRLLALLLALILALSAVSALGEQRPLWEKYYDLPLRSEDDE